MSRRRIPRVRPYRGKSSGSMWVVDGIRDQFGQRTRKFFPTQEAAKAWLDGSGFLASGYAMSVRPDVPAPAFILHKDNIGSLPVGPHIYFVWANENVIYVGQTMDMPSRFRSHEHIRWGSVISYIRSDPDELYYDECYYIALCKPTRNFGKLKRIGGQSQVVRRTEFQRAQDMQILTRCISVPEYELVASCSGYAK